MAFVAVENQKTFRTLCTAPVFQLISATYLVGSTDVILNNIILVKAPEYIGSADGHVVLGVDAADLQSAYMGDMLCDAGKAYLNGLRGSWTMAIALFGVRFCAH
ncbi:uncharacterized protein BCR38DRAFT_486901 [Pseudomassariella vexata]|uniref:Uncharacterized protein n=1 Tax=Pseudomassariella vexata TaxID=1141098 RepID=A0A1Y2DTY9_9PEZI|nr:uncharacterized protein BCR38DRAFT_486901 [Pseudomassariella vexata]ORY62639.1 hypothetical protein BCR38DRAFT_486901 [Pseudomassariella vexata]